MQEIARRQIVALQMTDSNTHDGERFKQLIEAGLTIGKINSCFADGACSWHEHFDQLEKLEITAKMPVPKNATIEYERNGVPLLIRKSRDKQVVEI